MVMVISSVCRWLLFFAADGVVVVAVVSVVAVVAVVAVVGGDGVEDSDADVVGCWLLLLRLLLFAVMVVMMMVVVMPVMMSVLMVVKFVVEGQFGKRSPFCDHQL